MLCRWHCERQRQDGGIHRHAAGNALHSLAFLPADRLLLSDREAENCNRILCEPTAQTFREASLYRTPGPLPNTNKVPSSSPPFLPAEGDHGLGPPLMAGFLLVGRPALSLAGPLPRWLAAVRRGGVMPRGT